MFHKTEEAVADLCQLLVCCNCFKLPEREVWLFGESCSHKFCENCANLFEGKQCMSCPPNSKLPKTNLKVDMFTSNLLQEFKQFGQYLVDQNFCNKNPTERLPTLGTNNENDNDLCQKSSGTEPVEKQETIVINESKPSDEERSDIIQDGAMNQQADQRMEIVLNSSDKKSEPKNLLTRNRPIRNSRPKMISNLLIKAPRAPPNQNEPCGAAQANEKISAASSIYDLDKTVDAEKNIISVAEFRRERKISKRPLEVEEPEPGRENSESPPLLTQHGNTPKKPVDLQAPAQTSSSVISSPVIPILTPAISSSKRTRGRQLNFNEKGKIPISMTSKNNEEFKDPDSPKLKVRKTIASPAGSNLSGVSGGSKHPDVKRSRRRHSRSSSVSSIASSHNESVKSNSTSNSTLVSAGSLEKCNAKGESKLHIACRNAQIEKVEKLIEMGADINARDFAGWTPLHEAINSKSKDNFQIIELLCAAGCQVNTPGLGNETPLHEGVRVGRIRVIKFLLSYGASTKLRNQSGQLPRDVTENETIQKILDEFNGPYVREPSENDYIEAFIKNSIAFFTYEANNSLLQCYKNDLHGEVTDEFSRAVTHMIFDAKEIQINKVPLTLNYLFAIMNGSWLLSSKWVEESAKQIKFKDWKSYEILGYLKTDEKFGVSTKPFNLSDKLLGEDVPKRSRTNKELDKPGLFHGFNFYLYKTCSFGTLSKKELSKLILIGDGKVINREPKPDTIDPLDDLSRFHAQTPNHKFTMTSHVILYNEENEPPKKYDLEHVKTLRIDWLIESILHFSLLDPDEFL